jgi:hypothetical protein
MDWLEVKHYLDKKIWRNPAATVLFSKRDFFAMWKRYGSSKRGKGAYGVICCNVTRDHGLQDKFKPPEGE